MPLKWLVNIAQTDDGGTLSLVEASSRFSPQKDSHSDDQVPTIHANGNPKSLVDVVLSRRSIRHYERKEIPRDVLEKILEAGRQAPSAMNRQPWHFIVLADDEIKKELSKWLFTRHIKNSPITIVGCANNGFLNKKWSIIGTSAALEIMVIAAWAMGVGSCWIGGFNEDKVKQLLNIPGNWKVVALVSLGYPRGNPHQKRRKPLEKITSINKFQESSTSALER